MNALVNYDEMCRAIDVCYSLDEIAKLENTAAALTAAARVAKNTETENKTRVIRLRAQRRMGELFSQLPKGRRGWPTQPKVDVAARVGVGRGIMYLYEELARVPQEKFEKAITQKKCPTTLALLNREFSFSSDLQAQLAVLQCLQRYWTRANATTKANFLVWAKEQ